MCLVGTELDNTGLGKYAQNSSIAMYLKLTYTKHTQNSKFFKKLQVSLKHN